MRLMTFKEPGNARSTTDWLLNSVWTFFTLVFLLLFVFYQWQQYRLEKKEALELTVLQASLRLDQFISVVSTSAKTYKLAEQDLSNCQQITLPILKKILFHNPSISGVVLSDKDNKILCSTLDSEERLPPPEAETLSIQGPLSLNQNYQDVFLIQQKQGEYFLGIYVLKQIIEKKLKSFSSPDRLLSIVDERENRTLLQVGNGLLARANLTNVAIARIPNMPDYLVIMTAPIPGFDNPFLFKEIPLSLIMAIISVLLYFKFRSILHHRFSLRYAMSYAIKQNHFEAAYQPIWDNSRKQFCGVEVLIRWKTDSNEIIMPDSFIDGAEQTGLIVPMTLQLMEKTFQQFQGYLEQHPDFHLAFNLSANHFLDTQFFNSFYELCAYFKISAKQITLELTERELLDQNNGQIIAKMQDLREKGYSLAIDDFGTGHASIKYLQHFPFNYLKIDKIFIQAIGSGAVTEHLNQAIIHMAQTLQLDIVAEGVETIEQFEFLKTQQIQFMQGWYFARALPYEKVIRILEK